MRTTILGISVVILILLGFVIKDTLFKIDIAATKNRLVQNEYLSKVHEIKDSNLLYLEIEKQIKFQENARNEQSAESIKDSRLLGLSMLLTMINIILMLIKRKKTTP